MFFQEVTSGVYHTGTLSRLNSLIRAVIVYNHANLPFVATNECRFIDMSLIHCI